MVFLYGWDHPRRNRPSRAAKSRWILVDLVTSIFHAVLLNLYSDFLFLFSDGGVKRVSGVELSKRSAFAWSRLLRTREKEG